MAEKKNKLAPPKDQTIFDLSGKAYQAKSQPSKKGTEKRLQTNITGKRSHNNTM